MAATSTVSYTHLAEERNDPHPENSSGTAGQDRTRGADDITGTNLGSDGCGQRLEGTHSALMLLAA